ncbi:hypothetical protein MTR67_048639, partial [Solanum verrucosum]
VTTLTQKKIKFLWSEAYEESFQELKDRTISAPVLILLKGSDGFVVYCDATRIGLGCVLMQNGYDMSVLYHPDKVNVVADALSRLSMDIVAHVEEEKRELVHDVNRFSQLDVQLIDSNEGVVVHKGFESSFVFDVKVKQSLDPMVELKEVVLKNSAEAFS